MWLGPLGMPGETAYYSLLEIGEPQKRRDHIYQFSVWSCRLASWGRSARALGLTVIGSVGSQEKLDDIVHTISVSMVASSMQMRSPMKRCLDYVLKVLISITTTSGGCAA